MNYFFRRCFINLKVYLINSLVFNTANSDQKLKLQGGVVPAIPRLWPIQQFSLLEVSTILGVRCLFIYYSAGTKCEVTVFLVCKLISFLASFSSNTPSSTLALSFNINCQLRGKVSSCRFTHSISYLSNNM